MNRRSFAYCCCNHFNAKPSYNKSREMCEKPPLNRRNLFYSECLVINFVSRPSSLSTALMGKSMEMNGPKVLHTLSELEFQLNSVSLLMMMMMRQMKFTSIQLSGWWLCVSTCRIRGIANSFSVAVESFRLRRELCEIEALRAQSRGQRNRFQWCNLIGLCKVTRFSN